jgi:hypothetical protein
VNAIARHWVSVVLVGSGAVGTLAAVSLLWQQSLVALATVAVCSALMLWGQRTGATLLTFAIVALLGPVSELVAIAGGAWTYASPFGPIAVPLWLPLVWGNAAVFVIHVYTEIHALRIPRMRSDHSESA